MPRIFMPRPEPRFGLSEEPTDRARGLAPYTVRLVRSGGILYGFGLHWLTPEEPERQDADMMTAMRDGFGPTHVAIRRGKRGQTGFGRLGSPAKVFAGASLLATEIRGKWAGVWPVTTIEGELLYLVVKSDRGLLLPNGDSLFEDEEAARSAILEAVEQDFRTFFSPLDWDLPVGPERDSKGGASHGDIGDILDQGKRRAMPLVPVARIRPWIKIRSLVRSRPRRMRLLAGFILSGAGAIGAAFVLTGHLMQKPPPPAMPPPVPVLPSWVPVETGLRACLDDLNRHWPAIPPWRTETGHCTVASEALVLRYDLVRESAVNGYAVDLLMAIYGRSATVTKGHAQITLPGQHLIRITRAPPYPEERKIEVFLGDEARRRTAQFTSNGVQTGPVLQLGPPAPRIFSSMGLEWRSSAGPEQWIGVFAALQTTGLVSLDVSRGEKGDTYVMKGVAYVR